MRVYRKLVPAELIAWSDHLKRLSPEARQARFSGTVSDETIEAYCRKIEWLTTVLVGAFVDGTLRGVAELRSLEPGTGWRAEVAVTVEDAWQDHGLGTELLRRAVVYARNRGLKSLYMICLTDNRRMQAIARKLEGQLSFEGSQVEADIAMPFPTQLTLLAEVLGDGAAFAAAFWDQFARPGPAAAP